MINFNEVQAKGEGQPVTGYGPVTEPKVHTTWIELCIPEELEEECREAVTKVLRRNGYAKGWDE